MMTSKASAENVRENKRRQNSAVCRPFQYLPVYSTRWSQMPLPLSTFLFYVPMLSPSLYSLPTSSLPCLSIPYHLLLSFPFITALTTSPSLLSHVTLIPSFTPLPPYPYTLSFYSWTLIATFFPFHIDLTPSASLLSHVTLPPSFPPFSSFPYRLLYPLLLISCIYLTQAFPLSSTPRHLPPPLSYHPFLTSPSCFLYHANIKPKLREVKTESTSKFCIDPLLIKWITKQLIVPDC